MAHETASGAVTPNNTEQTVCSLSTSYPLVDVYVANLTGAENADGTLWNLYAVSGGVETLIAQGKFVDQGPTRLLAGIKGSGATLTLKAVTDGVPATNAIKAVLFGWDPQEASLIEASSGTHALGTASFTFATLASYHPESDVLVDATGQPSVVNQALWELCVSFPSVAGFPLIPIAAQVQKQLQQQMFYGVFAGAELFAIRGRTVGPNTGAVTAAIIGRSPGGAGASPTPPVEEIVHLDPTSAGLLIGDHYAIKPGTNNVTKAVQAALDVAGTAAGIALQDILPGTSGVGASGGQVPASVTGLGAGDSGLAAVDPVTARTIRVVRPNGSEYRCGINTNQGDANLNYVAHITTSPYQRYNIQAYGAVADADFFFGLLIGSGATVLPTDNAPALMAARQAQVDSGYVGEIYAPVPKNAGSTPCYGVLQTVRWADAGALSFHFQGEKGEFLTSDVIFVFPCYIPTSIKDQHGVNIPNPIRTEVACFDYRGIASGYSVSNIYVIQPATQGPGGWKANMSVDFNRFTYPSIFGRPSFRNGFKGCCQVIYQGVGVGHVTGPSASDEPPWPLDFDQKEYYLPNDPYFGGTGTLFYLPFIFDSTVPANYLPFPVDPLNLQGVPWRYKVTAATGLMKAPETLEFMPYQGLAEPFVPGATYVAGDIVRPTDGAFNAAFGSYFVVTIGGVAGAEPIWNTTFAGTSVSGGVTFVNEGRIAPRSPGLTTVIYDDATTPTSTISIQLDSGHVGQPDPRSGQYVDPNINGVGGAITYNVLAPITTFFCETICAFESVRCEFIQGDGRRLFSAVGVPSDFSTDRNSIFRNCANDGLQLTGGDANSVHIFNPQFLGCGNTGYHDASFLGNAVDNGQYAIQTFENWGRYAARVDQVNAPTNFIHFYVEGGDPPMRMGGGIASLSFHQGLMSGYPDSSKFSVPQWGPAIGFAAANSPMNFGGYTAGYGWSAHRTVFPGDIVLATGVPYAFGILSVTGTIGVTTTGAVQPVAFGTNLPGDAPFTEVGVGGNITYINQGSKNNEVNVSDPTDGNSAFRILWSEGTALQMGMVTVPGGSLIQTRYATFHVDGVPNLGILGFDAANQRVKVWNEAVFGNGAGFERIWTWQGDSTAAPNYPGRIQGSVAWNNGNTPGGGGIQSARAGEGAAWWATGTNVWAHMAKIYTDDEEQFRARQLRRTGGTDIIDGTALPEAIAPRRIARTVVNAGIVVLDEVTIPDGSVCTVEYKYWVKQTAGAGNPKGAVGKATIAARRAGAVLTIEDAAVVTPGSSNELANAFTFDITSPPDIAFKFAANDATKTFLIGAECTVSGMPSADAELGALAIDQGASLTIVEGSTEIFGASGGKQPYTWSIHTDSGNGSSIVNAGDSGTYTAGSGGLFQPDDVVRVTDALGVTADCTVHIWNPSRFPNLDAWHRADRGATVAAGTISALADQSGNGYNFVSNGGNPTYNTSDGALNGQASVQTSGAGGTSLRNLTYARNRPWSFFWVGLSSDVVNDYIFTFGATPIMFQNATPKAVLNNGTSLIGSVDIQTKACVLGAFGTTADGTATGSFIGVNDWATGGVAGSANVLGTAVGIGVGEAAGLATFKAACHYAESVVINSNKAGIAAADITRMQTYVSNRYGITVT